MAVAFNHVHAMASSMSDDINPEVYAADPAQEGPAPDIKFEEVPKEADVGKEDKKTFTSDGTNHHYSPGMKQGKEFFAAKNLSYGTIDIAMALHQGGGTAFATNITMVYKTPGEYAEPLLRLVKNEAQQLMDELWGCGIRPTEVGSPGELGAVKAHLEDMRKITFDLVGLKK